MHGADLVIRGRRVMTPHGEREASVHVVDGTIEQVGAFDDVPIGSEVVDAADLAVLPGLVDTHVHVNEPGRTGWEGFATATRAAAAGGVTTIVDMPLNSIPPTTTVDALEEKRAAAEGRIHVDVGFWGGAVPENLGSLRELHEAGVFGFKSFLCPSGVDEFHPLDVDQLEAAMRELASFDGLLVVHAESPDEIKTEYAFTLNISDRAPFEYVTYLWSRPPEAEERAIAAVVEASERIGCRTHVLHLSAASALDVIEQAERVTAETCPHYLSFAAEEIPDGATEFKCAPPIREATNRERLWEGLRAGKVAAVVSDHSPSTPDLKAGSFLKAWGGIASLQLGLVAVWTGARERGFGLDDVARWMSGGPAALAGLVRKGAIAEGKDADLVLFDPDHRSVVDPSVLLHRHPTTPYAGRTLDGRVVATYVRGMEVFADGRISDARAGTLLSRDVS